MAPEKVEELDAHQATVEAPVGFTPGPWWAECRDLRWQVQAAHRGPGSNFCIAPINHWADSAEANARLIAMTPDLLTERNRLREALEKIRDKTSGGDTMTEIVEIVNRIAREALGAKQP
jgi:hypothetical protein